MLRKRRSSQSKFLSGMVGGVLLGLGCLWLGWLLFASHGNGTSGVSLWPAFSGSTSDSNVQVPSLLAEGISLSSTSQTPGLSQQQALLLANQLEPGAAAAAKGASAKYVLLNYPVTSTPATHANLNNVPVWMVWYQKIPEQASAYSSSSRTSYDLYVFVDANSGKEVLSVRV